jgi:F-type H+-transporting ATPase subunit gamma
MSETIASLQQKINNAGDLQSVVRTMKALAAANLGQYENATRTLEAYVHMVELGLGPCLRDSPPLGKMTAPKGQSSVFSAVVFGSDQGLVGRFNEAVVDHALAALTKRPGVHKVWAVGERVHARLIDADVAVVGLFAVPGSIQAIGPLVGRILVESADHRTGDGQTKSNRAGGDWAELHLFHNHPLPGASYEPVSRRLLPLDEQWRQQVTDRPWPTKTPPQIVGGALVTVRALIREYLFVSLFKASADSLAAENASRLAAMQRAERNIDDLLDTLKGAFRRSRQTAIDEELFDVVSGFEALS